LKLKRLILGRKAVHRIRLGCFYQILPIGRWQQCCTPSYHAVNRRIAPPGEITMKLKYLVLTVVAVSPSAVCQPIPGVRMPPEIGAAYGRLGKAIMAHDAAGVRSVWAEDFVVNSPNNEVLGREQVIAVMERDFLDYKDFKKHITFVGEKPEMTVIMGYDTMVPTKGLGAGKQVTRPFTDVWTKRSDGWKLVARQATIAAVN
jgi:ketosteroid isomerase-like protein